MVTDAIMDSCKKPAASLFFVYGGGTGKTCLQRILIARLRSICEIVLVVSSSGFASLLLLDGWTSHSHFKIPLELDDNSTCPISQQSNLCKLIQRTKLIIWDEAPTMQKNGFDVVNCTLRDLLCGVRENSKELSFGGITINCVRGRL